MATVSVQQVTYINTSFHPFGYAKLSHTRFTPFPVRATNEWDFATWCCTR